MTAQSQTAPIDPLGMTMLNPADGYAAFRLSPAGLSLPLSLSDPDWGVLLSVCECDLSPADFEPKPLIEALQFADDVFIAPRGMGFVDGRLFSGLCPQFQAAILSFAEDAMRRRRKVLMIAPHVTLLRQWEHVARAYAPDARFHVWPLEMVEQAAAA